MRTCRVGKAITAQASNLAIWRQLAGRCFRKWGFMSAASTIKAKPYVSKGTNAPWYKGWNLTKEERERFRANSIASQAAKAKAVRGECDGPKHPIPTPQLNPLDLMPQLPKNGLRALSLFSGCGGLDLGFDRAGFAHLASFDILPETGAVLHAVRPDWCVFAGDEGDVTQVDWRAYRGKVDVVHGGPPCQPFSHAGNQMGSHDVRDMIPQFVRAVREIQPLSFVCENVPGLASKKFESYVQIMIYDLLGHRYGIQSFLLDSSQFGIPQKRRRVFFVGFRERSSFENFCLPPPTHHWGESDSNGLPETMGARQALGLRDIGKDALAPTLRSGWTGPRNTTSVVNSTSAMRAWDFLEIWPNGVASDRKAASDFVAKNGHFRLSIQDCMVLQGFPADWPIKPPVYRALGLIGNSVSPPVGYAVATSIANALSTATIHPSAYQPA